MKQFIVNLENNVQLTYDIVNHDLTDSWSKLIVNRNISECCPINHYSGFASQELISARILRLYQLSDIINDFSPKKINKVEINADTWKNAFQIMHIHFPELKNDSNYEKYFPILTEYNDIIHWLESIFLNYNTKNLFRITIDFNKKIYEFYPLPNSAYELCEPFLNFGDLTLHYTHVGRHALEQFIVNDFTCPKDQFIPQRTFNASVRLTFNNYYQNTYKTKINLISEWQKFYYNKGGKNYWGYDINDPMIQFGFIKIGSLNNIQKNNQYINLKNTDFLVLLLSENKILNWEIKGA